MYIDKLLKKIIDILHLNKSGVGNKLSFIYDEISNRVVTFIAQDVEFKICFSSNFAAPLGLESGKYYSKGPHLAPYPADIHDGSSTLYVYSDIVQNVWWVIICFLFSRLFQRNQCRQCQVINGLGSINSEIVRNVFSRKKYQGIHMYFS